MNEVTYFSQANLLSFDNGVSCFIDLPPLFPDWSYTSAPFCIPKDRLAFTLHMGVIYNLFEGYDLHFVGRQIENSNLVEWTIDNSSVPDARNPIRKRIHFYYIENVAGSIVTNIEETAPNVAPVHDQGERLFRTTMEVISSDIRLSVTGLVEPARITITEGIARAGEHVPALNFDLGLSYSNYTEDGCRNRYFMAGREVTVTAAITNVRGLGGFRSAKFSWELQREENGSWVTIERSGPIDDPNFRFTPSETGRIRVRCTAEVTTDWQQTQEIGFRSAGFVTSVLDEEGLSLARTLCSFHTVIASTFPIPVRGAGRGRTIGRFRIIDPLWDPTPDQLKNVELSRAPYTHNELVRMRQMMQQNIKHAQAILDISARMLPKAEKLAIARIEAQAAAITKAAKAIPKIKNIKTTGKLVK